MQALPVVERLVDALLAIDVCVPNKISTFGCLVIFICQITAQELTNGVINTAFVMLFKVLGLD